MSFLSFHRMGSADWVQDTRFGGKLLDLGHYLSGPIDFLIGLPLAYISILFLLESESSSVGFQNHLWLFDMVPLSSGT